MAGTSESVLHAPPLEAGDRLTRDEFERRWKLAPQVKKAELIEGVVYMPTAVRYRPHGRPHSAIATLLGLYEAATPGVEAADGASLRLDNDNEPQPDLLLRLDRSLGGQSWEDDDEYLTGAPELVVEIAASTASYDLHQKLQVYRRHGVREYVVWRVFDQSIDWFVLREGNYLPLALDANGLFKSLVFPGLWFDAAALLRGDLAAAIATANLGLASPEHGDFASPLARKRGER